jgi:CTP synthase (UTP-ammonia lyase)
MQEASGSIDRPTSHAESRVDERSARRVRIAIVGDFDREKRSHWATEAALFHAAARLRLDVEPRWVATDVLAAEGVGRLAEFDGIWGAPGSPFASPTGMLRAIEFARVNSVPYLGTCAGFQYALIELTRNVLMIADADTAENNPGAEHIVITPIECSNPNHKVGSPRLTGADLAHPVPGTRLSHLCGSQGILEEYFCSFETNALFVPRWEAAGLRVAARGGGNGEVRGFELAETRFFLATLFQPQLSSSYDRPHPIITGYLAACTEKPSRGLR